MKKLGVTESYKLKRQVVVSASEACDRNRVLRFLKRNLVPVVIADSDLPQWNWKQVLCDLRHLPEPPHLVVASRMADDLFWAEVLNIGGYDVLARPFEAEELERVVASAHAHFTRHPGSLSISATRSRHNVA